MILDTYEQREQSINNKSLIQHSIDVFIKSFDKTGVDLESSQSIRGFYGAGPYDIEKVRYFYSSKESAFRKRLKEIGLIVSISKSFYYSYDTVQYNFYMRKGLEDSVCASNFLYRLVIYYEDKNLTYQTYKNLTYEIFTDPGETKGKRLSLLSHDTGY